MVWTKRGMDSHTLLFCRLVGSQTTGGRVERTTGQDHEESFGSPMGGVEQGYGKGSSVVGSVRLLRPETGVLYLSLGERVVSVSQSHKTSYLCHKDQ